MESEIEHLPSYSFNKEHLQRQLEIVKSAAQLAKTEIDYQSAHNESLLLAIRLVEDFLRSKHRVCYGGQAINAYLPKEHKFYDPEYSIPDYDFFTPSQIDDLKILIHSLYEAGFAEVSAREGMHEGTIKLYVNFIPVADLTAIDPRIYRILARRSKAFDGISYIDPNSLRMLMYLELSRPRGEVTRLEKVFERLVLFNEFVPLGRRKRGAAYSGNEFVPLKGYKRVKSFRDEPLQGYKRNTSDEPLQEQEQEQEPLKEERTVGGKRAFKDTLTLAQVQFLLRYMIQNQRMFAGGELVPFYDNAVSKNQQNLSYFLTSKKPIIFFSPDPKADAARIASELGATRAIRTSVFYNEGLDVIPSIHVLYSGRATLVIIIEQSACHSYINIGIKDEIVTGLSHSILRIASMDTLITLFFSLGFVQNRFFDRGAMDSLANQLVEISIRARRNADHTIFPFLSIRCAGHQTSLPSLIRAKLKRMTQRKTHDLREIMYEAEVKYGLREPRKERKKDAGDKEDGGDKKDAGDKKEAGDKKIRRRHRTLKKV